MGQRASIELNKDIALIIKKICSELGYKTKVKFNYNKLMFLLVVLYLVNPDSFLEKFSGFVLKYKHFLYRSKNGKPYVLKKEKVLEIIRQKKVTVNKVSLMAWGSTNLYNYLIYNKKHRLNLTQVKKLAKVLEVDIDEIAYRADYLKLNCFKNY